MKKLELTLEQARVLHKQGGQWAEIVLNTFTLNELYPPTLWNIWNNQLLALGEEQDLWYISYDGSISSINFTLGDLKKCKQDNYKHFMPTEKAAKKILALCQIAIMSEYWNKIERDDRGEAKLRYRPFLVPMINGSYNVGVASNSDNREFPFSFPSSGCLTKAINYNKQIFIDALSD